MRVFLTGATGFIGSAIVRELIGAGHEVLGLARSDSAAALLAAAGAEAHRGTLGDLESLRRGAASSDGVIHTAFVHDNFSDFAGACETDRNAIAALGEAIAGSNRPLIVTSGTALLRPGRLATEDDAADPASAAAPRVPSEGIGLAAAAQGVRAALLRLPPSVHGDGDHGFVPSLIKLAREKGVSAYVGDGSNRWPAVHRLDAAHLFRLAVEAAPAGSRLHAVGDAGIPFRDIAAVIGRRLNLPVVAVSAEDASGHFGWLTPFVCLDNPSSSVLTQEGLGWRPQQPGLIQDLEEGRYFAD